MRRIGWIAAGLVIVLAGRADALLYLAEGSLESMLVRSGTVVIATVETVDGDSATLKVAETFKGKAEATLAVRGVNLRITSEQSKARFAKGETAVVFLTTTANGTLAIVYSQTLPSEGEVKSMKGCVAEVLPFAETLNDLGNPKKEVNQEQVVEAVKVLEASRNGYTQVAMGRWMGTVLAKRLKPETCTEQIAEAINTGRNELQLGAIQWARAYQELPASVRTALEKQEKGSKSKAVAEAAANALTEAKKKAPDTRPGA